MGTNKDNPSWLKIYLSNAIKDAITEYYKVYNEKDFSRNRKLPFQKMVELLLSMQGGSLKKELYDAGIKVTATAFVQQRDKISWEVFEKILLLFNERCTDSKTYKGYKVFAVDGTTVNMARNESSESYVKSDSTSKGYNQFHVTPLYDVLNKTYQYCCIQPQPKQDEIGALAVMLAWLDFKEKTLIVADRGFEGYNIFAHLMSKPNVDFLVRVKQERGAMREIGKLPMMELDTDVSFTVTTTQTNEDKKNNHIFIKTRKNENRAYSSKSHLGRWDFPSPYPMKFRVVRILLDNGEYETLATSLPRSITKEEIKELYHARWGIETAFRELKYGLGLVNLHGKKDDFVRQEIYASMIMANLCSRIVNQIVISKKVTNIYEYQINMKMAIYLCRKFFRSERADEDKLLEDIARYVEPIRPGRRDE